MQSDQVYLEMSGHVFRRYVRVLTCNIRMPICTVKQGPATRNLPNVPRNHGSAHNCLMWFFRSKGYASVQCLLPLVACACLVLTCAGEARAQTRRAQLRIVSLAPARLRIDVELPAATNVLSFRNTYGGVLGLGDRIERVEASRDARNIQVRKLAPGEYQSETEFTRLSYDVNVTEPAQPAQMSHVSWLNKEHGLLMLADLLPRPRDSVNIATTITLEVPAGWTAASNLARKDDEYSTADPDKGVYLVGPSVRAKSRRIGPTDLSLITSDEWPLSDSDALKIAEKLIKEYSNLTGHALKQNAILMLIPFPGEAGPERWSAETRGNAVVLLLGRKASRKRVLTKLGIVLSHEIFHLWVPNALRLAGDYDWFFEGFTLYQALRTDLRLGLISFTTYLETIARVYDSHLSSGDGDRLSLIAASARRWTTSSSHVYDKGMLVAFVYDLMLRNAADCQSPLDDVYRQLFRRHGTGHGTANETIIKLLTEPTGMESFGHDYVERPGRIDLEPALAAYGLQLHRGVPGRSTTRLGLASALNKTQRKALRCLGYRG